MLLFSCLETVWHKIVIHSDTNRSLRSILFHVPEPLCTHRWLAANVSWTLVWKMKMFSSESLFLPYFLCKVLQLCSICKIIRLSRLPFDFLSAIKCCTAVGSAAGRRTVTVTTAPSRQWRLRNQRCVASAVVRWREGKKRKENTVMNNALWSFSNFCH